MKYKCFLRTLTAAINNGYLRNKDVMEILDEQVLGCNGVNVVNEANKYVQQRLITYELRKKLYVRLRKCLFLVIKLFQMSTCHSNT